MSYQPDNGLRSNTAKCKGTGMNSYGSKGPQMADFTFGIFIGVIIGAGLMYWFLL